MDDRLQKFARLVEIGSFTKAAKQLHISQPALTLSINKLEQELGAELLIRGNRKLDITEAGKAAYDAATEHQNITDDLRNNLNRIAHKRPHVTIGMTDSIAAALCYTAAFDQLESSAHVTIVVNNSRYLREAVEHRQLDVAFTIDDEVEHPSLQKVTIGSEQLLFVCHPDVASATNTEISNGKLHNFISYDKPSTTFRHVQHALHALDIKPYMTLFSTSPDVMLQMVLRGRGTAALPNHLVEDLVSSGELSLLGVGKTAIIARRPVCRLQLIGKTLPHCLIDFLESATI